MKTEIDPTFMFFNEFSLSGPILGSTIVFIHILSKEFIRFSQPF